MHAVLTCAIILIFSRGAVTVRDATPATPPAKIARHISRGEASNGIGGGAKSEPTQCADDVINKLDTPS